MEGDVGELGRHVGEGGAEVVLPEELGVGEAGGEDAGVAGEDGGAVVGGLAVGGEEVGGDLARDRVAQGEELLVGAHGGLQDLGGEVEEAGLDAAEERHGPFGEAGVLGEEAGVVDEIEAGGEGELARVVGDAGGAGLRVEDDVGAGELGLVVLEGGDGEGVRGVEAVAAGQVAGGDAVDLEGDDLGAGLAGEDAEDRVQRADPAQGAVAPAHGLRPGEGADGGLDGLGDDLGRRAAGAVDDGDEDVALLVGAGLELGAGEAGGAEEAVDGLGGGVGAWALALLAEAGGAVGEAGEGEGEAAGRGEGGGVGVGEAALDEAVGDEAAQVLGRLPLHPGGDLLGEEFEQEVGHRGAFGGARMANRKRRGRSRGNAGRGRGVRVRSPGAAGFTVRREWDIHLAHAKEGCRGQQIRAKSACSGTTGARRCGFRWSSSCRGTARSSGRTATA